MQRSIATVSISGTLVEKPAALIAVSFSTSVPLMETVAIERCM